MERALACMHARAPSYDLNKSFRIRDPKNRTSAEVTVDGGGNNIGADCAPAAVRRLAPQLLDAQNKR